MSEPEISRRCLSCGASIRKRAVFCPECGYQVDGDESKLDPTIQQSESVNGHSTSLSENSPEISKRAGLAITGAEDLQPKPEPDGLADKNSETARVKPLTVLATSAAQRVSAVGGQKMHRATAAAREVIEENVLQRVEKLRKVSSVVIDEAAYDPSLRFLLVAALLFAIFLLIVVLDKLIG